MGRIKEIWKDVPLAGYSNNYEISNLGRLRGKSRWIEVYRNGEKYKRFVKSKIKATRHSKMAQHYFTDISYIDEFSVVHIRTVYIHKLVGDAFLPPNSQKTLVSHKILDYTNNRADNLFRSDQFDVSKRSMELYPENRNNLRDANIKSGYYEKLRKKGTRAK